VPQGSEALGKLKVEGKEDKKGNTKGANIARNL